MSYGDILNTIPISAVRRGLEKIKDLLVTAYIAADVVVTNAHVAADVVVTNAHIAADVVVTNAHVAADVVVDDARKEVGQVANVEVAFADVRAANTTPVVLIADPGVGKYIIVDEVLLFHDYGGATYAFTGTASIQYGAVEGGADVITPYPDDATILEATGDALDVSHGVDCIPVEGDGSDTGQIIYASAADSITGTGVFKFSIKYRIVAIA